jgi:hypothetical protein
MDTICHSLDYPDLSVESLDKDKSKRRLVLTTAIFGQIAR